jgi:hypothetical protein
MKMRDCYKTIWPEFKIWDFGPNEEDPDLKWWTECDESNDEDIMIYSYDFARFGLNEEYQYSFINGEDVTITKDATWCNPGDLIGSVQPKMRNVLIGAARLAFAAYRGVEG